MLETKIFNTLSKEKESFKPIDSKQVTFYHCGPTVYWTQHIGNMRSMVMADLIRRTLLYVGYNVKFVRNYTDVGHLTGDNIGDADSGEDRMEKGAKREGLTPQEIADKYISQFERDTKALNVLEPDVKPRATDYIDEMIEMVQTLLDKGFAYTTPKAVYFDVSKADDYTRLSGQKLDLNKSGAGKGDISDPEKRLPQDFALWFFRTGVHSNALQYWESPFTSAEVENGIGFPGWHIECSAMSRKELGKTIDIHMGGIEHIPVHHTNEIAQSESANGVEFTHYWLHNEWLILENEKISKSSGHSLSVDDLVEKGYDPLALRYFFLNAHYRSQQNFTWKGLDAAATALNNLKFHVSRWKDESQDKKSETGAGNGSAGKILEVWRMKFTELLVEDFNVPSALAVVWDLLKSDAAASDKLASLLDFDNVLGLNLTEVLSTEEAKEKLGAEKVSAIEENVIARLEHRKAKNFELSDKIRDDFHKNGIDIIDLPDGSSEWFVSDLDKAKEGDF